MRTPKEFTLTLKQASNIFTNFVRKPDDNNLLAITDSLISNLLQAVKFDENTNIHKLFGVVSTDKDYIATTGQAAIFVVPLILSIYVNTIPAEDTTTTCRRLEAVRAEKINDNDLYEVADAGYRSFILAAVDEAWYHELSNLRTIHSQATANQLLAHLRTGIQNIDAITILPSMMSMYKYVDSIPEYTNVIED